jgi:hypothetical protein
MKYDIDFESQPCIVQFQHCKDEIGISKRNAYRLADGNYVVKWNTGGHRRRLIEHRGTFVTSSGKSVGDLAFWTEWEAKTIAHKLRHLASNCNMCAKRIHRVLTPVCNEVADMCSPETPDCAGEDMSYQNTDPCVFGASFKYSFCKQDATHGLRCLPPGSLIVFGSIHDGQYFLDTVFVVASNPVVYETSAAGVAMIDCSNEYRKLTLERLISNPPGEYVFYRGVSFKCGNPAPFSFTPAYKFSTDRIKSRESYEAEANSEQCRKRCLLDLQELNAKAGKHGFLARNPFDISRTRPTTITPANRQCIKAVWDDIVSQVAKQGFVLGVCFDWPK